MRLRPAKNHLPSGNVLSRLRKCVHAIARKTSIAEGDEGTNKYYLHAKLVNPTLFD